MSRKTNGSGRSAIVSELVQLAEQSDDAENWRELARSVKGDKDKPYVEREENLLRVARAMRDAGVVEGAHAFFLVASPIIYIAEERWLEEKNPALEQISKRMEEIKKRHGLGDDEDWLQGEGPDDWQKLNDEYSRLLDEITAATFDEYGEADLAAMYRHDRGRFDRLFEEGRQQFFGSPKKTQG